MPPSHSSASPSAQFDPSDSWDINAIGCDTCLDDFPRTETHYHCVICAGGDWNMCSRCFGKGKRCSRRHKLYRRQLTSLYRDLDNHLYCDRCRTEFPKDQTHYTCKHCYNSKYSMCSTCHDNGGRCPGEHFLCKRTLPLDDAPGDGEGGEHDPLPDLYMNRSITSLLDELYRDVEL